MYKTGFITSRYRETEDRRGIWRAEGNKEIEKLEIHVPQSESATTHRGNMVRFGKLYKGKISQDKIVVDDGLTLKWMMPFGEEKEQNKLYKMNFDKMGEERNEQ